VNGNLSVICPITLERTPVEGIPPRCACCDEALPPLYLDEKQKLLPLPIQLFGLAGHGKTAYLAALTMALQRVNMLWEGFTATPATESSRRIVREFNVLYERGQLPPRTLPGARDCYLMLLNRVPKWMNAALMVRDCPGAAFQELPVDLREASYLLKGHLTLMLVSLPDLRDGYTIDSLMTTLLSTLIANGVELERAKKQVVVVLTKADLLLEALPDDLALYVREDPIWQVARDESESKPFLVQEMNAYLGAMEEISKRIKSWIWRQAAGRTLVTLARDRNVEIRFSLVSATGSAPRAQDNTLPLGWEPSRVLDPLLWALELDSQRRREIS
jgi:double-GTPase-like protein